MYGWRAKIGLISPMSENAEHAFHIYAPEGVSFASTKINFPGPTPEGLVFLSDQLEESVRMFRKWHHDVILFGCTSGSCIKGVGWDQECVRRIERASGHPGLTTSTAVLEAFRALGTKKAAVLTHYPEEIRRRKSFWRTTAWRPPPSPASASTGPASSPIPANTSCTARPRS